MQWKDVTIREYLEINDIVNSQLYDTLQKDIKILSILYKKPERYFEDMDLTQFKKLVLEISFLNNLSFKEGLPARIKVAGKRFRINLKVTDLSAGQYIDLLNYSKEKDKIMDNMHNILSIFIKPCNIFGKLKKETPDHALFLYNNLTMDVAYPCCVFFCSLWANLTPVMVSYLTSEMTQMNEQIKKHLQATGDGS